MIKYSRYCSRYKMADTLYFVTIIMSCSGRVMNFSGRSQSLGDISGRGGTLDKGAASYAHPLASTSGTFLLNTSTATPVPAPRLETDVPDIFSHGSPIGEDFHPDNSVLDSDDGVEPCSVSASASASPVLVPQPVPAALAMSRTSKQTKLPSATWTRAPTLALTLHVSNRWTQSTINADQHASQKPLLTSSA